MNCQECKTTKNVMEYLAPLDATLCSRCYKEIWLTWIDIHEYVRVELMGIG